MIRLTCTCDTATFIAKIIPYLELFFIHQNESIFLYTSDIIADIIHVMFDEQQISVQKMISSAVFGRRLTELSSYLSQFYDLSTEIRLSRPLNINNNAHLAHRYIYCVSPKYPGISTIVLSGILGELIDRGIDKEDIYIIGNPLERPPLNIGIDVKSNIDAFSFLKYCREFITNDINWYNIAILCNCRKITLMIQRENEKDVYKMGNPFGASINVLQYSITNYQNPS